VVAVVAPAELHELGVQAVLQPSRLFAQLIHLSWLSRANAKASP
tara:strand:- start:287 stop:418 length:132 start_codon:yes stop_codon:yes gene_type:complete